MATHVTKFGSGMQFARHELLPPREREVLEQIVGGASNKETGRHLGIGPRTIRSAPRPHHGQAWRKEYGRPGADCAQPGPRTLIAAAKAI
jgi:hypothetical protein